MKKTAGVLILGMAFHVVSFAQQKNVPPPPPPAPPKVKKVTDNPPPPPPPPKIEKVKQIAPPPPPPPKIEQVEVVSPPPPPPPPPKEPRKVKKTSKTSGDIPEPVIEVVKFAPPKKSTRKEEVKKNKEVKKFQPPTIVKDSE